MTFIRNLLVASAAGAGVAYYLKNNYIYVGEYLEENPFKFNQLSTAGKVKYVLGGGLNDDVASTKAYKWINPNKNPYLFDFFEKEIDAATTKKILAKYKTNDEMIVALEKGVFLGPTMWYHRFFISPYLKANPTHNKMTGFTSLEPGLKEVDVAKLPTVAGWVPFIKGAPILPKNKYVPYYWDASQFQNLTKPVEMNSVLYGKFSALEHGKTSNGGFFQFGFGSDIYPSSAIHRLDYFIRSDPKTKQDKLVIRMTNVLGFTAPKSPKFKDESNGLHEFMTRTIVLDVIRYLEREA